MAAPPVPAPSCPVCTELLVNAKIAACGHSVCSACAHRLGGATACPVCRQTGVTFDMCNYALRDCVELLLGRERYAAELRRVTRLVPIQSVAEFDLKYGCGRFSSSDALPTITVMDVLRYVDRRQRQHDEEPSVPEVAGYHVAVVASGGADAKANLPYAVWDGPWTHMHVAVEDTHYDFILMPKPAPPPPPPEEVPSFSFVSVAAQPQQPFSFSSPFSQHL